MFWLITGIIISIILAITSSWDVEDFACYIVFGTIISILSAFIISAIIGAIISCNVKPIIKLNETVELTALKDDSSYSGSFFLGCGTVDEKQYYYYIEKTDLGMKSNKISVDNAYIQYSSETPRIEMYDKCFPKKWYGWFAMPLWGGYNIIYIPEGSVTAGFNVDLE